MSLSLQVLGGASLTGPEGPFKGPVTQRHRLALLAVLAASHPRAVGRDKVMALLWPERDLENARQLLNQAVHTIRRAAGDDAIITAGEELQLGAAVIASDVVAFEEALAAGDAEGAVRLYAGPFLDGFFLSEAAEFERWVDRQRDRLATAVAGATEGLAEAAGRAGDPNAELRWWKVRADQDPLDSRVARRLMEAMERAGNRAAAVQHGRAHQQLLAQELDIAPDPAIEALIERLRRETAAPAPAPPNVATGPPPAAPADVTINAAARLATPDPVARSTAGRGLLALAGVAVIVVAAVKLLPGTRPATVAATPAVVDEIAQAVARELARRDRHDSGAVPREQRTRSIAAYEAFLRGSDPLVLRSDSAARRGLAHFRRAVELDSGYAAAWAGLARLSNRTAGNTPDERARGLASAETAARKALALDDSLADAHATLAFTRMNRGDLPGTEVELRRAVELEPDAARYRESLVRLYVWWGRPNDALAEARHAVGLQPMSPTANAELARALLAADSVDRALAQLERVRGLDPPLLRVATIAAQCYDHKEMVPEAIAAIRTSAESGQPLSIGLYGYLLARAGGADSARRLVGTLERENRNALNVGLIHAGLGDFDTAIRWLDRAVDDWSLRPGTELAPTVHRILSAHRRDPRVEALRLRLGLQNR